MIWILIILGLVVVIFLSGCKKTIIPNPPEPKPEPEPPGPIDPHPWKWQLVDLTTERWKNYCEYMKRMASDTLLAAELRKKVLVDGVWKYFYHWVSDWDLFHVLDYWDQPDEVWKRGTCDCDGFSRLTSDVIGRFIMLVLKTITEVHWLEYYGFYRKYTYNPETGEFSYKIVAGGHAITVYKKEGKLLAFSNTSWWNKLNFQNYLDIGEQTFPEGLYLVISRHWRTGKMEWMLKAKSGEILEGTNIFHRRLRLMRNLEHLKRGERKRVKGMM